LVSRPDFRKGIRLWFCHGELRFASSKKNPRDETDETEFGFRVSPNQDTAVWKRDNDRTKNRGPFKRTERPAAKTSRAKLHEKGLHEVGDNAQGANQRDWPEKIEVRRAHGALDADGIDGVNKFAAVQKLCVCIHAVLTSRRRANR
jgi:hypothetical protein